MKKLLCALLYFFGLASSIGQANAFGYFGNHEMYDFLGMSGFGMFFGLGLFAVFTGILLFAFWLWMLVDCLKRSFKRDYEKIVWVLVMIFLHLLGAVVYYFIVKSAHRNSGKINSEKIKSNKEKKDKT